jgi:hypothetical protein
MGHKYCTLLDHQESATDYLRKFYAEVTQGIILFTLIKRNIVRETLCKNLAQEETKSMQFIRVPVGHI